MDDLKSNKWFWAVVLMTFFNIMVFAVGKVVVDKAAERVIQRLQKPYSPSPYGPGLDPDKVNLEALNQQQDKQVYMLRQKLSSDGHLEQEQIQGLSSLDEAAAMSDAWRAEWERSRGFSL